MYKRNKSKRKQTKKYKGKRNGKTSRIRRGGCDECIGSTAKLWNN